MKKVCIVDYKGGNVGSVYNVFAKIADEVKITNKISDLKDCSHIILPGVGAFASCYDSLKNSIDIDELKEIIVDQGKPFLGICVGMQILATSGFEFIESPGLDLIPGKVRKIESQGQVLPHVGWNNIICSDAFKSFDGNDFYFVHSYCFSEVDKKYVVGEVSYGETFPVIVQRDNIWGVQFHPEKSQISGQRFLKHFLERV